MYYNLTRRELKEKSGTDFKGGDVINITDSHFEIWIEYGSFARPNMHSRLFDVNKGKFQDVAFRPEYIRDFLRR